MSKRKGAPLISWEDDDDDDDLDNIESEDEEAEDRDDDEEEEEEEEEDDPAETAEEKRVRMARAYLGRLKESGRAAGGRADDDEEDGESESDDDDGDYIEGQLRRDVQDSRGQLFRPLAGRVGKLKPPAVEVYRGHSLSATAVAMCEDESSAFTGSKDRSVIRWDVETGAKLAYLGRGRRRQRGKAKAADGHTDDVLALAASTDGRYLASGGRDRTVRIWDLRTNTLVQSFKGHRDAVCALAFRRYSSSLFSGSNDRTVKIWNIDQLAYVETLFGHQSEIHCIDSLRKDRAVSSGSDRSVRLWKVVEESQLVFEKGHTASVEALTMIDEQHFVSGGSDGMICLWSATKKRPVVRVDDAHKKLDQAAVDHEWGAEPRWITALASVRSSDLVASGSCDGHVRLWHCNPSAGRMEQVSAIPMDGFVNGIAFGKSGKVLAAAVGQEHRLGRWGIQKKARNGLRIVRLTGLAQEEEEEEEEEE